MELFGSSPCMEQVAFMGDQVVDLRRRLADARTNVQVFAEFVLLKLYAIVI